MACQRPFEELELGFKHVESDVKYIQHGKKENLCIFKLNRSWRHLTSVYHLLPNNSFGKDKTIKRAVKMLQTVAEDRYVYLHVKLGSNINKNNIITW